MMDPREHNRIAWDAQVEQGNEWTVPVSDDKIESARGGDLNIFLTPTKPVPVSWFPSLKNADILCLASGGGQQGPLLAAAGANVTVFDNSPAQLAQDRSVAERHNLAINTIQGDMVDLSAFDNESFDLIVHPVSNVFSSEVLPVWCESYRVLRPGGTLLAGFDNPIVHMFEGEAYDRGELKLAHKLPSSEAVTLSDEEKAERLKNGQPLEFGHTLESQIGGQIAAGFVISGFYEDHDRTQWDDLLGNYTDIYIATRALKMK